MDNRRLYETSVNSALGKIAAHVPEDIVARFAGVSGMGRDDFRPIPPGPSGTVSAVDGSNAMVLEGGSIALAAIRAGRTTFAGTVRSGRAITPLTLVTIGPLHRNYDFDDLYRECFGIPPHKGLDNSDPDRAAEALRDTLEYWVTSQNHEPVLAGIIKKAGERDLLLAAVAKRTRATWGGGHPLLPALRGLAGQIGITGPWWTK